MVDVDDEIADLQVAQVREERLGRGAAALRRAALFLEDVGFGVDLQARVRQPEAARQPADRHEHRRIPRVLGALDRHREDVVFLEQLDGALGPARRRGDEQRRLAAVAQLADLGDPVGARGRASRPPAGSGRDAGRRPIGAASVRRAPSCASAVASPAWRERRANRRSASAVGEELGRRQHLPFVPRDRFVVAALHLLDQLRARCVSTSSRSETRIRDACARDEVVEQRRRPIGRRPAAPSRPSARRAAGRCRADRSARSIAASPGRRCGATRSCRR